MTTKADPTYAQLRNHVLTLIQEATSHAVVAR